ncbi:MAG TPA: hypothetical protein VFN88_04770 [Caulobacteraceae bacterium]|nr:hypothetical protein [Caulobacteraceae bacterium]
MNAIETATTLTLPGLQKELDRLRRGERLTIAGSTCHRLFGDDSLARERLDHFASGHHCSAIAFDGAVTFHKRG